MARTYNTHQRQVHQAIKRHETTQRDTYIPSYTVKPKAKPLRKPFPDPKRRYRTHLSSPPPSRTPSPSPTSGPFTLPWHHIHPPLTTTNHRSTLTPGTILATPFVVPDAFRTSTSSPPPPASLAVSGSPSFPATQQNRIDTPFGPLYIKIRYMVALARFRTHILAAPVFSYSGRGIRHLNPRAREEYMGIAYRGDRRSGAAGRDGGSPWPALVVEEDLVTDKDGWKFTPHSFVHVAGATRVECEAPITVVGRVERESAERLVQVWKGVVEESFGGDMGSWYEKERYEEERGDEGYTSQEREISEERCSSGRASPTYEQYEAPWST